MIELPSNDHSSDQISRLTAVYTIMNSSNRIQPNQLLWAYNTLHDPNHVIYYYKKEYSTNQLMLHPITKPYSIIKNQAEFLIDNLSHNYIKDPHYNQTVADANLAMAVAKYNKGENASEFLIDNLSHNYIKDSHYNVNNLQKEIWFTNRILNLEEPMFKQEDANCHQIPDPISHTNVCSYSQLKDISKKIDDLTQKGFISNFYNTTERVHAIESPVETYVSYLNHFIIISLIVGPITYIAASKYYIKRKAK